MSLNMDELNRKIEENLKLQEEMKKERISPLLFEDCQKTMSLRKAEESGTIFRFF